MSHQPLARRRVGSLLCSQMETGSLQLLLEIRTHAKLSQSKIAQLVGTSLVSVSRWERGVGNPSPAQAERISRLHRMVMNDNPPEASDGKAAFSSRGVRTRAPGQGVLGDQLQIVRLTQGVRPPILSGISKDRVFDENGKNAIAALLTAHPQPAPTAEASLEGNISAGKNTYTYDAHTYHTKVPPQGIAELIRHYLPSGGLVLDPFAGSGMTGVAARVVGADCFLNELSPAACFIASRFASSAVLPAEFEAAVQAVLDETKAIRKSLYSTQCRECGKQAELLYVVWSYRVLCNRCGREFQLWNECRSYGRVVRERKIYARPRPIRRTRPRTPILRGRPI